MSINIVKVDLGVDLLDSIAKDIKSKISNNKEVIVLVSNKRPIRFISQYLSFVEMLKTEFYTLDGFYKKLVMTFYSDENIKYLSPLENYFILLKTIKEFPDLYTMLGGTDEKVFSWCKKIYSLLSEIERELLHDKIKDFQYVEAPQGIKGILEQLKLLYEKYKNNMKYFTNNSDIYIKLQSILNKDTLIEFLSQKEFVVLGPIYLSKVDVNFFKAVSEKSELTYYIHTELHRRDLMVKGDKEFRFGIFDIVEDTIDILKKEIKTHNLLEIKGEKVLPELEIYETDDSLSECRITKDIINNVKKDNNLVGIVLPDEKNLFPLLTQFKKDDGINVTMGYSLTNTEFGIFVNSLFEVLTTIYQRYIKGGQIFVPTIPLLKLLDSGIIRRLPASFFDYQSLNREIFDRKLSIFELKDDYLKFFERFIKVKSFEDFYQIMYEVVNSIELKENDEILLESIKVFTKDILIPLKNINIDNISMNIALIANIVTNLMDDAALLFEGNPIKGVQIMGALESRYLPLNTVVYIDLNEGVIPSVNPIDPLIPEEIKRELGLSSYRDREKLQRYNFFRTIFSCKKSVLIYKVGGNSNDKYLRSRFIDQLILLREVDSNKRYNVKKSTVNIIPSIVSEDGVKKDDDTYGIIIEQMKNKGFTPTILDEYITCPYMFYFKRIKGVPAKVNFYNNFEADKAGSLMHLILQKSFEDKLGKKLDNNLLEDALSKGKGLIDGLPKSIEKFSNYFTTFFEKMDDLRFDMLKIVLNKRFEQYINFQKGNLVNEEIEIKGLEIELYDKELAVRGIADRIEEVKFKDDSVSLRVIDYKTGRVIKTFSNGRLNKIDMNNLDIKYCRDGIKYIKEKIPSVQLPVYILMASRCYDNYGSYESVIYKLGNSQNIKGSSFKVNIDNEDFDKLKKLVSYIINHIVQSCYFYALPGDNCQYCEYSYCCKFER